MLLVQVRKTMYTRFYFSATSHDCDEDFCEFIIVLLGASCSYVYQTVSHTFEIVINAIW